MVLPVQVVLLVVKWLMEDTVAVLNQMLFAVMITFTVVQMDTLVMLLMEGVLKEMM